jgi:Flp pilus assembly secretin CpaC
MLFAGFLLILLSVGDAVAQNSAPTTTTNEPLVHIKAERSSLTITERFSKVVQFENRILRVDGFDPETLTVTALSPTQLRLQALAPGVTTLVVTDQNDKIFTVEIFVSGDVRHLQAYIDRFFPKASVQAIAIRDAVVLRGWVTKPAHITELVEIAEQFYPKTLNQMKVGGVQQVLLKVKIIEAQRTKIRRFGMNWAFRNNNSFVASTPGMLTPLAGLTTPFGMAPTIGFDATSFGDPSITFGITGTDEAFNGFIEALKQESLLKILAEPEIVIMNGRPATLLAGGEFPIIVPAGLGTATIEWREFGTRLEAVAIVLDNDTVRLELQAEVSDRDFANAVSLDGTGSLTMPPGGNLQPYPESIKISPEGLRPPAPSNLTPSNLTPSNPTLSIPALSIPAPALRTDSTTRSTIRPGLVVPRIDTSAVQRNSARSNGAVPSRQSASSGKEPNWWVGSRSRPSARPRLFRQVGYDDGYVQRPSATVRQVGGILQPRPSVNRSASRIRGPARPRLIEPKSRVIQSNYNQN